MASTETVVIVSAIRILDSIPGYKFNSRRFSRMTKRHFWRHGALRQWLGVFRRVRFYSLRKTSTLVMANTTIPRSDGKDAPAYVVGEANKSAVIVIQEW